MEFFCGENQVFYFFKIKFVTTLFRNFPWEETNFFRGKKWKYLSKDEKKL